MQQILTIVLICTLLTHVQRSAGGDDVMWKQVHHVELDSPEDLEHWQLEGAGEAAVTEQGELRVTNRQEVIDGVETQGSVMWYRRPFWGDVRLEFDCRAEPQSRAILFFNARATGDDRNLFAWERPRALYEDYAFEPRTELYTIGLLRSDEGVLNLRRLGGQIKPEWMEVLAYHPSLFPQRYLTAEEMVAAARAAGVETLPERMDEMRKVTSHEAFREALKPHLARWRQVDASFQEASIVSRYAGRRPVFEDPQHVYRVRVTTLGNNVTVEVDGQTIIDFGETQREPLRGGYFGFRNFRATSAWYSNIRIYERAEQE